MTNVTLKENARKRGNKLLSVNVKVSLGLKHKLNSNKSEKCKLIMIVCKRKI